MPDKSFAEVAEWAIDVLKERGAPVGRRLNAQAVLMDMARTLDGQRGALDPDLVRRACFDPGQFAEREFTPSDYGGTDAEPLHAWQARAVLVALSQRAAA